VATIGAMEVRPFWGDEDAEGQIRRLDVELTEAPRTAHRVRSRTAPRAGPLRDEFLIKIQAMDGVDPEVIRTLVEERLSWARGKLARYEGSATGSSTAEPRSSTSRTRTGSARTSRSWEESPWRRRPSAGANGRLSS
jgi:hypothetical protein